MTEFIESQKRSMKRSIIFSSDFYISIQFNIRLLRFNRVNYQLLLFSSHNIHFLDQYYCDRMGNSQSNILYDNPVPMESQIMSNPSSKSIPAAVGTYNFEVPMIHKQQKQQMKLERTEPTNNETTLQPPITIQLSNVTLMQKTLEEHSQQVSHQPQQKQKTQIQQWHETFLQCEQFYSLHQIDFAYPLAIQLIVNVPEIHRLKKPLLQTIVDQYKMVESYYKQVYSPGWQLKAEKQKLRISSRRDNETAAVLIENEIEIPLEIFSAVIINFDLYYKFMPFMQSSKLAKDLNRNSKIGHCISNIPIISNRQSFFQGLGYDRLQHNGTIFLCTRSIHNDLEFQKKVGYQCKLTEGAVQLEYKYFVMEYVPISKKKGSLKLAMNIDLKLPYVPMWIIDIASRNFGFQFYTNMVDISQKFKGSQWEKGIEKNSDLFNFFKGIVENYLISHK